MKNLIIPLVLFYSFGAQAISCRSLLSSETSKPTTQIYDGDNGYRFLRIEIKTDSQKEISEILIRDKPGGDSMFSGHFLFSASPEASVRTHKANQNISSITKTDFKFNNNDLALQTDTLIFRLHFVSENEIVLAPLMRGSNYPLPDFQLRRRP